MVACTAVQHRHLVRQVERRGDHRHEICAQHLQGYCAVDGRLHAWVVACEKLGDRLRIAGMDARETVLEVHDAYDLRRSLSRTEGEKDPEEQSWERSCSLMSCPKRSHGEV